MKNNYYKIKTIKKTQYCKYNHLVNALTREHGLLKLKWDKSNCWLIWGIDFHKSWAGHDVSWIDMKHQQEVQLNISKFFFSLFKLVRHILFNLKSMFTAIFRSAATYCTFVSASLNKNWTYLPLLEIFIFLLQIEKMAWNFISCVLTLYESTQT